MVTALAPAFGRSNDDVQLYKALTPRFCGTLQSVPDQLTLTGSQPKVSKRWYEAGPIRTLALAVAALTPFIGGCTKPSTPVAGPATVMAEADVEAERASKVAIEVTPGLFSQTLQGQIPNGSVNLLTQPKLLGQTITGSFDGNVFSLEISPKLFSRHFEGDVAGGKVSFDISPKLFGHQVQGTFAAQPVDLEITPSWASKKIEGRFMGGPVSLILSPDWFSKKITGSFHGATVDLKIGPKLFGETLNGTFQGKPVFIELSPKMFALKVDGKAQLGKEGKAAFLMGWLLDQHTELIHAKPSNHDDD